MLVSETGWYLSVCETACLTVLRSASLAQVNAMLREQLDQANSANQALSEDIRKLTADWTKAREELEQREVDWRREEEVGLYSMSEILLNIQMQIFFQVVQVCTET